MSFLGPEATSCYSCSLVALSSSASGWPLNRRVGTVLAGRGPTPNKTSLFKVISSLLASALPTVVGFPNYPKSCHHLKDISGGYLMGTGEPLTTMWHTLLSPTRTLALHRIYIAPTSKGLEAPGRYLMPALSPTNARAAKQRLLCNALDIDTAGLLICSH